MKNPSLEKGKTVAAELAMQAMDKAAPSYAPRVPGLPAAYCAHIDFGVVRLHIYRWTWRGKCAQFHVTPDADGWVTILKRRYWLAPRTLRLCEAQCDDSDKPESQAMRANALRMWVGQSVEMPERAAAVSQAAVNRYRLRQAAAVLTEHLPHGYSLLVGCDRPAAYRVEGAEVVFITPRSDAAKRKGEDKLRLDRRSIFGTVIYRGVEYAVKDDRLYRPGKPEDLWTSAPSADDSLLVRETAPLNAHILGDGQAWYVLVPGTLPCIEFHTYVRGLEQVKIARIKNGLVQYKDSSYAVTPDGKLTGVQA